MPQIVLLNSREQRDKCLGKLKQLARKDMSTVANQKTAQPRENAVDLP